MKTEEEKYTFTKDTLPLHFADPSQYIYGRAKKTLSRIIGYGQNYVSKLKAVLRNYWLWAKPCLKISATKLTSLDIPFALFRRINFPFITCFSPNMEFSPSMASFCPRKFFLSLLYDLFLS